MRQIEFVPGNYYHVLNRAVEERDVFISEIDYKRFLSYLVVFNDLNAPPRNLSRLSRKPKDLISLYSPDRRDPLVDIISFTVLSNHFHLFVKEEIKGGISLFMQKLCMGYALYFNLKNERAGSLWQGTFKAKLIDSEPYFVHIMSYVHLNILDLYYPEWREGKLKDWVMAEKKMREYLWSSYGYYRTGKSDIPFMDLILTKQDWFSEHFPERKSFETNPRLWSTRFIL